MKNLITLSLALSFFLSAQAQYYGVDDASPKQWAIGLKLGTGVLDADVQADFPGYQIGIYGQKAITRFLDFRLQLNGGILYGLDTDASSGFVGNSVWNGQRNEDINYVDTDGESFVFYNHRTQYYQATALFKLNLNRAFTKVGMEDWDVYLLAGVGALAYNTRIDAFNDATQSIYDFQNQITGDSKQEIRDQLKSLLDGNYETLGQLDVVNQQGFGDNVLNTTFVVGFGAKYMIFQQWGVGLEANYSFVGDDLIDGQRWNNDNSESPDNDRIASASLFVEYKF